MTAWVKEENDLPGQPKAHAAMTKEVKGPIYFLDNTPWGKAVM